MLGTILGSLLLIFNIYGFLLMAWDKRQARKQGPRIAEARFFSLALFGASIGILAAIFVFRHKSKKWSFKGRIYTIAGGQFFLLVFTWRYLSSIL